MLRANNNGTFTVSSVYTPRFQDFESFLGLGGFEVSRQLQRSTPGQGCTDPEDHLPACRRPKPLLLRSLGQRFQGLYQCLSGYRLRWMIVTTPSSPYGEFPEIIALGPSHLRLNSQPHSSSEEMTHQLASCSTLTFGLVTPARSATLSHGTPSTGKVYRILVSHDSPAGQN